MKKLLGALFLLALCSSFAAATVPDPAFCSLSPIYGNVGVPAEEAVIVIPTNTALWEGAKYTITVHNSSDLPIAGAVVQVTFAPSIAICPSAVHSGVTDANGVWITYFRGGGCLTNVGQACVVTANGIQIREVRSVRSQDNGDHTTSQPTLNCDTVDLTFFGGEFKGVDPAACHDYDLNDACDTVDLVSFGDAFKAAWTCAP